MLGQATGKDACPGTIHIAAQELFAVPKSRRPVIFVSFFEIYGGKLYDLLRSRSEVKCMEDYHGDIQLAGLVEKKVDSFEEMLDYITRGQEQRKTGATFSNQASSRSHAVLQWAFVRGGTSAGSASSSSLSGHNVHHHHLRKKLEVGRISFIDLAGVGVWGCGCGGVEVWVWVYCTAKSHLNDR
jgi:kinesin family protein 2/24